MAAKPSSVVRWADVGGAIVVPTSGKMDVGHVPGERPPAQIENWAKNLEGQWQAYLNDGAFAGAFALVSDITPTGVSGTQNDYNPTGWGSGPTGAQVIRIDRPNGVTLTGLAGGSDGRIAIIIDLGTTADFVTLRHDDGAASTAANRFLLPYNQDWQMPLGGVAVLRYDAVASRWKLIASNGPGGEIEISPAAFVGSVNDWNPTGLASARIIRLDSGTGLVNVNLTGLTAPTNNRARRITIMVVNTSGNTLTLVNESASSSAANRFRCPGGADVTVPLGGAVELYYDFTDSRWRVLAQSL